ncbi:hypothetical protein [Lentibacillus cibarius]|uniref:hypothetical protein n=1 Tax=Lentibacillus cibarius TaxID=2583219 RepID=UPI001F2EFD7C|nr:hypothetical protein [Lentibacillus cibarius]
MTATTTVPEPPLIDMGETELPFGVGALIKSGNGLLGIVGAFVLLGLSFILCLN